MKLKLLYEDYKFYDNLLSEELKGWRKYVAIAALALTGGAGGALAKLGVNASQAQQITSQVQAKPELQSYLQYAMQNADEQFAELSKDMDATDAYANVALKGGNPNSAENSGLTKDQQGRTDNMINRQMVNDAEANQLADKWMQDA